MFEDYFFIYKDANGRWNKATNPVFIAEHKECIAIRKDEMADINEHIKSLNKKQSFMIYKDGGRAKVGDLVEHPAYYARGIVENEDGDVRIPAYGYEQNAVKLCIKVEQDG